MSEPVKRQNKYNVALKVWNEERKKKGFEWLSPKKGTDEYKEVQDLKSSLKKDEKKVKEKKVKEVQLVKSKDKPSATINKLLKINKKITENLIQEKDNKKILLLVEKLKENTLMLTKVRENL